MWRPWHSSPTTAQFKSRFFTKDVDPSRIHEGGLFEREHMWAPIGLILSILKARGVSIDSDILANFLPLIVPIGPEASVQHDERQRKYEKNIFQLFPVHPFGDNQKPILWFEFSPVTCPKRREAFEQWRDGTPSGEGHCGSMVRQQ